MKRNDNSQKSAHEKKQRIPVWLYPDTLRAIDTAMEQANCKSRSEFLENAARMYICCNGDGYLWTVRGLQLACVRPPVAMPNQR